MWEKAFSNLSETQTNIDEYPDGLQISTLDELKSLLDLLHIKHCLLKPYFETEDYPLVEARELLPSFDIDLYEFKKLPGFSMVAFERPLEPFQEVFQYDALYPLINWRAGELQGAACAMEESVVSSNIRTFQSRLPKRNHADFINEFSEKDICALDYYAKLLPFLLELERAHILAHDTTGHFALQGLYASLPSNLDTELKQFGLKIGKFKPGDSLLYECNRNFVYQFLMELHGFPIVSERRTSAAMFARRLNRERERFLVRVQGQSDRTITTFTSHPPGTRRRRGQFPMVEKIALTQVGENQKDAIELLQDQGFFVDPAKRVVILRVTYQQHQYNPKNVRESRALSVSKQEIIHPITGRTLDHLNIIQDIKSMLLRLNDIVRGEFHGTMSYKRREVLTSTDTHEKRLKFLYTWLSKHLHRIIDYSDEYYSQVVKVLDGYLLSPENYDIFNEYNQLHQEVWSKYSQIQQSRKVRILEDLRNRHYKGEPVSYERMLELMVGILSDLKFEIVNYFDKLVVKVLEIGDDVINDRYLVRNYLEVDENKLSPYGRRVRKLYFELVTLLDEFKSIRKSRTAIANAPQFQDF